MKKHKKEGYKDVVCHWFLCYGYEEREDVFWITVATYGEASVFSLGDLWDTVYEEKVGIVGFKTGVSAAGI